MNVIHQSVSKHEFLKAAKSCRHLSVSQPRPETVWLEPCDREAQTVTADCPHSYGSVYSRDRLGDDGWGLLQETLMIQRQRNRAENTEKTNCPSVVSSKSFPCEWTSPRTISSLSKAYRFIVLIVLGYSAFMSSYWIKTTSSGAVKTN